MCFKVPSSWLILHQKRGRVKDDPLVIVKLKIESNKSGYCGDSYYNLECAKKGKDTCRMKRKGSIPRLYPEGCPRQFSAHVIYRVKVIK